MATQRLGHTSELPALGEIVWWNLSNVGVPYTLLEDSLFKAHIRRSGFMETLRKVKAHTVRARLADNGHKVVAANLLRKDKYVIVTLVTQDKAETEDPELTMPVTLEATDDGSFHIVAGADTSAAAAFTEHYGFWREHADGHELSRAIPAYVRSECLPLSARDTGGVYFVPRAYVQRLDALEAAVQSIEDRMSGITTPVVQIFRLRVVDEERAREDLKMRLFEEMDRALAEYEEGVRAWANGETSPTAKGRETRLAELRKLKYHLDAYASFLEANASTIFQRLDGLVDALSVPDRM